MIKNKIICGDAIKTIETFDDNSVDMVIFSPPYDNLRDYNGYSFDMHGLGVELYRVVKEGSIVAVIMQDQTIDGRKTLSTFRTVIDWCDSIGFNLFECNIYKKNGKDGAWWTKRFRVDHEYILLFLKGKKPKHFDKSMIKIPSKHAGKLMKGGANRDKNGKTQLSKHLKINDLKCPGTIWDCANGGDKIALKRKHPATFPDKIPYQLIQCFTQPNEVVLDPMVGSGSTAITAHILKRYYIGIDLSEEYCLLAEERIKTKQTNMIDGFKNNPANSGGLIKKLEM